ncbi:MAG TPA: carboxylating nicotinate-nucleotide diphosphorylase [Deltaproteobacteria bacterium]|nr:carboxylating nicotinate-nucleotide diphosphorylase [Deltaproteobacteria bacterium]
MKLSSHKIKNIIKTALKEDIGSGDITTNAILKERGKGEGGRGTAKIIVKENLVVAGLSVAGEVFKQLDKKAVFKPLVKDGEGVKKGQCIAEVKGRLRTLLTGERVALNFLQRLSSITTLTRQFVDAVKGYDVKILDTRKTTPNLRILEKYAVRCGGGFNHRFGLYDAILIKDNHIAAAGGIKNAVALAKKNAPKKKIEVEVKNFKELKEALEAKVHVIMLDNMTPSQMKGAVSFIRITHHASRITLIEASGGVNLKNVKKIAKTGIHRISIGALTHSARGVDISMEIVKQLRVKSYE